MERGLFMLVLRACPHCHGDLVYEQDPHTGYLTCLQCGHILSMTEERHLGVRANRKGLVQLPPQPRHPIPHADVWIRIPAAR